MRLNLPVTNNEYELDARQSIVTTTDLQGNIVYANPYFVEASGFAESDLIGAPQNIVRHPDMPTAAFADLWSSIKAGLPWRGMVKNRRRNGDYYWVLANVTPIIEDGKAVGYMSVRTKPNRKQIEAAATLYKQEKDKPGSLILRQGRVFKSRWHRALVALMEMPLGLRLGLSFALLLGAITIFGAAAASLDTVQRMGLGPWLVAFAAMLFAAVGGLWYFVAKDIVAPLTQAVTLAQRMAGGDLTADITTDRGDEIGQMIRALCQLNTNLHSIVGDIRLNFHTMLHAAQQIAVGNNDLSGRTDSQAAALEETAASIEEINAAVKQNADHSSQGDEMAHTALSSTEKGGSIVMKVIDTIADISQSSNKISEIVGIINGIANQTNLLALNAAVEAARAGEAGRGFAVVATEVRELAQRSATAAMNIKQLIEESVSRVNAGTILARDAGTAMEEILASIRGVSRVMGDISSASHEQSTGIDQVNTAVTQLDEVTQQNAAMVEKAAAATRDLEEQGRKLMQALTVFKLGRKDTAMATTMPAPLRTPAGIKRKAA
ncbi:methyl-accepting chemotaxis protein [Microbacteriaceae bacterium K1510]|nr:methyl-accepting chemotaxis protein [Microbacteriaceae bacterium K1510]